MGTHSAVVVDAKELNDEQVSYLIRCCDDPKSDSWHTMTVAIPDHGALLDEMKTLVAARHEAKVAWRAQSVAVKINTPAGAHTPEVLETGENSDEIVFYRIRCCGDDTTDCLIEITLFNAATKDAPSTWSQELNDKLTAVATKHEAKLAWRMKQGQAPLLAAPASRISPSDPGTVSILAEGEAP